MPVYIFLPCSYSCSILSCSSHTCQKLSAISMNLGAFIKLLSYLKKLPHLPARYCPQVRHHNSQSKYSETSTSVQHQDFYLAHLPHFALTQTRVTDVGWQCLKLPWLVCIYDNDLRLNDYLIFSFSESRNKEDSSGDGVIS